MLLTLWWKVSLHTAAASGTAAILVLSFGPLFILALPPIVLVAWSRIRLGDHTPAQTLAGAALGGLVATAVFILLR
jgi:membrane-associated phospholipid phosphatase